MHLKLIFVVLILKEINAENPDRSKPVRNAKYVVSNPPYVYPTPATPFEEHALAHKVPEHTVTKVRPYDWRDPSHPNPDFHSVVGGDPLLAALLIRDTVGLKQKPPAYNHADHLPVNPYVSLLLSHYGRYVPLFGMKYGIYGYNAANNFHNNKPFGAYKIVDAH